MDPLDPRDRLDRLTTLREELEQIAESDFRDTYVAKTSLDGEPVVSIVFDINVATLSPILARDLAVRIANQARSGKTTAHYLPEREVIAVHHTLLGTKPH